MKALGVASFCMLALATPGFAASVTVADSSAVLPNAANDTTALLLDAGLKAQNAGGGKYTVAANNSLAMMSGRDTPRAQSSTWLTMPSASLGSNQVDFGGMTAPASATAMRSCICVG